jgi:hypothetical protein
MNFSPILPLRDWPDISAVCRKKKLNWRPLFPGKSIAGSLV